MTCRRFPLETLTLFACGIAPPHLAREIVSHVDRCAGCRHALEHLTSWDACDSGRPSSAPAQGWGPFMARLDAEIDRQPRPVIRFSFFPNPRLATVAAALLLMVGVLTGVQVAARDPGASSVQADNQAFTDGVQKHLRRSKLVVLGLAAKDATGVAPDLTFERALAADLLPETRLYRVAASHRRLAGMAAAFGDLEVVLLQTAYSDAPDVEALGQVQRLIDSRDLTFTLETLAAPPAGWTYPTRVSDGVGR